MFTLAVAVALTLGADLSDAEKEIVAGLGEPERMYCEFAVTYSEDGVLGAGALKEMESGASGRFKTNLVYVKVIDKSNVLMTDRLRRKNEFGMFVDIPGDTFWISGIDTSSMSDSDDTLGVPKSTLFVVIGQKTYESPTGQQTVKHLAAVDLEAVRPALEKLLAGRGMRTWTLDGRHVRAAMKSGRNPVVLTTPEGDAIRVRKTRLSADDRDWITAELRRRAEQ